MRARRPGLGAATLLLVVSLVPGTTLAAQVEGASGPDTTARPQASQAEPDVPYVATPMPVVDAMLELARVGPRDSLFDLGSGDGRIVRRAAERWGTPGVGVEIDSGLVATSRREAREAGIEELVTFIRGDLFRTDLSSASVVTLYLLTSVNRELRPKLFEELRPGTRVVSHAFGMAEWGADSLVRVPPEGERQAYVYYWVIPADVAGTWRLTTSDGQVLTVEIDQLFQELRMQVVEGPEGLVIRDPLLRGTSLGFHLARLGDAGARQRFVGSVFDDEMRGAHPGGAWTATRIDGGGQPIDRW